MTPKEAVAVLVAAFRQEQIPLPTVRLYGKKLGDIAPDLLEAVVHRVIETARFFPSIAELRDTAGQLAGLLPAGPEEALALVRRADVEEAIYRRDGTYAYTERHWRWPKEVTAVTFDALHRALGKVGDPVNGEARVFGWDHDFKQAYAGVAAEVTRRALADLSQATLPLGRRALAAGDEL